MPTFVWPEDIRTKIDYIKTPGHDSYMTNLDAEKVNDLPKIKKIFHSISGTQILFILHLKQYYV